MQKKLRCNFCGKEIIPGNRPDGIPNGPGFQMHDGKIMNMCADCLINLGSLIAAMRGDDDERKD